ncbi:plasma membrane ATPase 4 [Phtheirospermum japonicum]|uniref:Plasma membrane ATPase 4 n=1 Tax=Phtheirospermum japonicum TaxID=374723 RepID=A0A830BRI8_9LAMI|nr:plasma membrane ATPase 4 [Phtheirospermum japonicum]
MKLKNKNSARNLSINNLLEVTDILSAVNKICCFTKESVDPSGKNNGFNFTLFSCGARIHFATGLFGDGQRLSSEGRLVNLQGIPFKQTSVSRNNIAELDADYIAQDQNRGFLLAPSPIP